MIELSLKRKSQQEDQLDEKEEENPLSMRFEEECNGKKNIHHESNN